MVTPVGGHRRTLTIETTMGRYKALIGPRMQARGFAAQKAEVSISVAVLNLMLATGTSEIRP